MWIQVRTIDGKQTARVDSLSKLTKIEDLRKLLIEHFDAEPSDQRLFFRGKQLEDGHTLFDYNVGLNDLIQLMVHVKPTPAIEASSTPKALPKDSDENNSDKENKEPDSDGEVNQGLSSHSGLISEEGNVYKVGDIIDARDPTLGAWFEAKIVNIIKNKSTSSAQHASKAQDSCSSTQQTRGSSSSSDVLSQQCRHKIDEKDMNEAHTNMIKTVENEHDKGCKEHGFADNNDEHVSELLITKEKCNEDKSGDENGNVVTTNNPNLTNCKEGNSEAIPCIRQIETTGVLMPKISTSKNNVKEIDAVSSSLMLFMKDISDDLKKQGILCETAIDDGFIYKVVFEGYEDDVRDLSSKDIRPRARHLVHFDIVKEGQTIMANFNFEEPESRGFWYDCLITKKKYSRTQKELYATVYLGADLMPLENCRLIFLSELFEIEKPGTQLTERDVFLNPSASPAKRQNKPECDFCKDNPRRKCKHCACCVCGGKNNPERQLMCDECDQAYHLDCLSPPLTDVPEDDDWYCPECKRDENEVIKAGEKLKLSKKKSKMASANSSSCRDWGKGMACVGRTKQCTIVPSNHYGPIPGVEVGTMWKFRVQVSEAGVHRPHVAGIHGREEDGAYSIVLSGGYEDDTDNGGEFYYTGSGGRDLSGNKRTAEQSCDQKLTRMNKALAKNCNAAIDCKKGAAATDWRGGKPVRVVRNCKGRKHSKYAPEEGNRYDGIYKVVKYWPEKGISGFLVWRYLLRRDDPAPGPWTKEGQKYCQRLGLTMQYPEGYLANQEEKEKRLSENGSTKSSESDEDLNPQKHGHKRKLTASPKSEETKKSKTMPFQINKSIMKLIKEDTENQKLWKLAMNHLSEGKQKFLQQLEELFMCICCQELLYKPVTLQCSHNFCKPCIQRSFKAEVYSCPACRMDVPKNASQPVNVSLSKVLNHFYPGYEVGRE